MTKFQTPQSNYISVVRDGRALFRIDPERGIVEIMHRGTMEYIDLAAEIERHRQRQIATINAAMN